MTNPILLLSDADRACVHLLAAGLTTRQAAARLHIQPSSFKNRIHIAKHRSGIPTRDRLVACYVAAYGLPELQE